ncbi:hypothetical protein [Methylobacter sp. YRD-M1]|uniref:hypothetical protein n=1 Tax=Methylobacter sp. YRD-M1 TaxID=2911520 RepID=UPI00227D68F2|nr:hypothetical protein [Methylobacter sp. YRD-M1]WAK02862.1 hypothetical protein LZ558_03500 [Methylobacter sp. YRD-M1]
METIVACTFPQHGSLEHSKLSDKPTIVNSEFSDKKNVNSSLNLTMPDAKITPLLKKNMRSSLLPKLAAIFTSLGF